MATASKIKSAIRTRGASQRKLAGDLSAVSSTLLEAEVDSSLNALKQQQSDQFFSTLSSGLEAASSFGERLKQRRDLKENVEAFKTSLPDEAKEKFRIEKAPSLMDVFKKKTGISEYLSSKVNMEQDQYFLGERKLGSQYDVAARGKSILSEKAVEDLLELTDDPSMMDMTTPSLNMEMPKMNFDFKSIYGQPSAIPLRNYDPDPMYQFVTDDDQQIVDTERGNT
jgi:hypothetical protein